MRPTGDANSFPPCQRICPGACVMPAAVSTEITPALEAAGRLSRAAHRFPWLWFQVLRRRRGVIDLYRKVLIGEESYRSFEDQVWAGTPRSVVMLFGLLADRGGSGGRRQELRSW